MTVNQSQSSTLAGGEKPPEAREIFIAARAHALPVSMGRSQWVMKCDTQPHLRREAELGGGLREEFVEESTETLHCHRKGMLARAVPVTQQGDSERAGCSEPSAHRLEKRGGSQLAARRRAKTLSITLSLPHPAAPCSVLPDSTGESPKGGSPWRPCKPSPNSEVFEDHIHENSAVHGFLQETGNEIAIRSEFLRACFQGPPCRIQADSEGVSVLLAVRRQQPEPNQLPFSSEV